ncbi:hypothetical protein PVAP13_3NG080005 [Panicum virgatum]|uniref:Uncharacterized protein n=1 Tax=Panicum virgatum TaxID=38727 RepID=A0A8T0UC47_PANVG|nr:hypothetical protein PVAP13_3NG080005 [Panicum virgatum]
MNEIRVVVRVCRNGVQRASGVWAMGNQVWRVAQTGRGRQWRGGSWAATASSTRNGANAPARCQGKREVSAFLCGRAVSREQKNVQAGPTEQAEPAKPSFWGGGGGSIYYLII